MNPRKKQRRFALFTQQQEAELNHEIEQFIVSYILPHTKRIKQDNQKIGKK